MILKSHPAQFKGRAFQGAVQLNSHIHKDVKSFYFENLLFFHSEDFLSAQSRTVSVELYLQQNRLLKYKAGVELEWALFSDATKAVSEPGQFRESLHGTVIFWYKIYMYYEIC